jgi:predicted metal-dependent peptidase
MSNKEALAPKPEGRVSPVKMTSQQRLEVFRGAREKLALSIVDFFNDYPLYYFMLSRMVRVPDPSIGTIGVGFKRIRAGEVTATAITLFYNPYYIIRQSSKKMRVILSHECQHVGLKHLMRMHNHELRLFNLAADVVVNSNIPEIQELGEVDCYVCPQVPAGEQCPACTSPENPYGPGKLSEWDGVDQSKFDVLKGKNIREMSSEEIYDLLLPRYEEVKKQMEAALAAGMNPDDHSQWDGGSEGSSGENADALGRALSPEEVAAIDTILRESSQALQGRDPGNIPGNMKREIEELMKSKVDWRQLLTMFAQNVVREERESSWRRVNRRMVGAGRGYVAPGRRKLFRPNMLVVVDNSGSTAGAIYNLFMSQCVKLADVCEELDMIGVDTRVNFEVSIKDGKLPKDFDLRSGGGTSFQPAFDYAKKKKYDGVIYLTDGYADHNINVHGIPTLFAVSPGGARVEGFRNIMIEEEK